MAEILDINLETDLSEFTSTVTDGGDLSQAGAAALASTSGGLSSLIDDTTDIYGANTFTTFTSGILRFRFYIDPNGLAMASGDQFEVVQILGSTSNNRTRVLLEYNGTNYRIRAGTLDDGSTTQFTSLYTVTDAEHYIEVRVEYASSDVASDGTLTLWFDGSQQETITNIDLFDLSQWNESRIGAAKNIDAGTSGTLYQDEFVVRDDGNLIGAVGSAVSAVPIPWTRRYTLLRM